jgi:biopolymer transport protein ExbD
MKFRRSHKIDRGWIDFIPFLNIVFLLVFFSLLTSSLVYQPGIRIDLPSADVVDIARAIDPIIVSIAKDNRIYVNERAVSREAIPELLKKTLGKNPKRLVILKADSNIAHDRVVDVMNILAKAGVRKISIAAQPRSRTAGRQ